MHGYLTMQHPAALSLSILYTMTSLPQINNLEAAITKIIYHHLPNNKINAAYWVTIEKDGENIATGQTVSAE